MFPLYAENFSELFSGINVIPFLIISVANGILLFFASLKFMLVLQQSGYRSKRYFKWLTSPETPYLSRLMLLCIMGFLFFCVLNTCFVPIAGKTYASYIGFVAYAIFTIMYIDTEKSVNVKVPLKKTHRLVRLAVTFIILLILVSFGLITLLNLFAYLIDDEMVAILRFSLICGMPILTPYILFLAYIINQPFEQILKKHYMNIAVQKLKSSCVIKIGITGSYGKTSVKEILNTILSQKFRVLSSPESYNTPMGIALTVKKLDSTHDVFIAEMGARQKGDIKELTQMVNPDIAILTGINNQHLESFGSIENIKNTKYELFEYMKKGKAFFSADNGDCKDLYSKFKGEKYLAGIGGKNDTVYATDIITTNKGTTFTLNIKGEEPIPCSTILLGTHSVSNICLASAVAYKMGLSPLEIALGINRIKSIGHRLELVPNNKDIVIIDDSYNASESGIAAAMEVLDTFNGRKIVVTPGLVELGKIENVANLNLGKILAHHADKVIIIGKHNAEMLINGLKEEGFNVEDIIFEKSTSRGNKALNVMLKKGDVVLFENDLPDNYS